GLLSGYRDLYAPRTFTVPPGYQYDHNTHGFAILNGRSCFSQLPTLRGRYSFTHSTTIARSFYKVLYLLRQHQRYGTSIDWHQANAHCEKREKFKSRVLIHHTAYIAPRS